MPRFARHIPSALLLTFGSAMSHAASFDCTLAGSQTETMVCADPGLSKLDEQLGARYAAFRAQPGNDAEKAVQSGWLKARNACRDAACLRSAYEQRIAELDARSASTGPIAGYWEKVYYCTDATGAYGQRCREGDRDVFKLSIRVAGTRICITHMATSGLGRRVDEVEDTTPSMRGAVKDKTATVRFRSAWEGTGTALLQVQGNTLHWKVTSKDAGQSHIPDEEVLTRVAARPSDRLPDCAAR